MCRPIKFKKSRHSGLETSTYTLQCEIAKKQYSVLLDLRTGHRLPWSSISVENFSLYCLGDWSLTLTTQCYFIQFWEHWNTPPIVVIDLQAILMPVINCGIPFPECWKISMSENFRILPCLKYAAWSLTFRRSGSGLFDIFTNIILLRIFPL